MGNEPMEDILWDWDREELENSCIHSAVKNKAYNTQNTIKSDPSELNPLELLVNYSITHLPTSLKRACIFLYCPSVCGVTNPIPILPAILIIPFVK